MDKGNDFAELRRKYIGSGDVGPILGVCPWASKYDIFLQKLGLQEVEVTERMQTGSDIEAWIVNERYIPGMTKAGKDIRVVKPPILIHPKYPWFAVHCDGIVFDADPRFPRYYEVAKVGDYDPLSEVDWRVAGKSLCGAEVKNIQIKKKEQWGEIGTDQIPDTYWWQCQACMEVTDLGFWDVPVLFSGNRYEPFRVYRDKEKMAKAMVELIEFRGRVEANDPPPIDESESANQFLSAWYRKEEDIEVIANREVDKAVRGRFAALLEIAEYEAIKIECENIICDNMKTATTLIGSDYKGTWRFEPKTKVNYKAIIEEAGIDPELIVKHTSKPKPKKRTFRLRKQVAE